MLPKISVIMPVYNETNSELNDSINSILNQTYPNFELIIIDDNPRSVRIKNYLIKHYSFSNKIKIFFNKKNLKLIKSETKGIRLSSGKYIARIDADDISYKNRLRDQIHFLMYNNLDLVYANFSIINEKGDLTRRRTYNVSINTVNQNNVKKMVLCGSTVGPTFLYKKDVFNKIHGYRQINGEDYDLVARFLIHGYKVGFEARSVIFKRLRKNSITYTGSLSQYVTQRTISDYLRIYNFKKILPMSVLNRNIDNITQNQLTQFKRYATYRYNFNDKRTVINFIKIILSILFSKIVFKRCLWSLMNKYKINHIIK